MTQDEHDDIAGPLEDSVLEMRQLVETLTNENAQLRLLVDHGAMEIVGRMQVEIGALRERVHALTQEKADAVRTNQLLKARLNKRAKEATK